MILYVGSCTDRWFDQSHVSWNPAEFFTRSFSGLFCSSWLNTELHMYTTGPRCSILGQRIKYKMDKFARIEPYTSTVDSCRSRGVTGSSSLLVLVQVSGQILTHTYTLTQRNDFFISSFIDIFSNLIIIWNLFSFYNTEKCVFIWIEILNFCWREENTVILAVSILLLGVSTVLVSHRTGPHV